MYVNISVADVHLESATMIKAKTRIKALVAIESKKLQQAVRNSTLFDVCLNLEKMKEKKTSGSTTTTFAPDNMLSKLGHPICAPCVEKVQAVSKKVMKFGKGFWVTVEAIYWIMTILATAATTWLMVDVAEKDTIGSSSIFTPLNVECYQDLKDTMSWYADTDLQTYDDPCNLGSVLDCERGGFELSPLRKLTKCVMDNMNAIVEYQRDAVIAITAISRVHDLVDIVATHFNIEKSAHHIQRELADDEENDKEYDVSMVTRMCDLGKKADDFEARFTTSLQEILEM